MPRPSNFHPAEVALREYMRRRWRFPRIPGLALVRDAGDCPGVACSADHCTARSCTCAPCACITCRAQRLVASAPRPVIDLHLQAAQLRMDIDEAA
jgi:hypothetical protein